MLHGDLAPGDVLVEPGGGFTLLVLRGAEEGFSYLDLATGKVRSDVARMITPGCRVANSFELLKGQAPRPIKRMGR